MGLLARLLPSALRRWLLASLGDPSGDKFARIFHASPDWIVITRLSDSMIVDANQGFETISGYRAAEVIGHPISQFNIWVHPDQRTKMVAELMRTGTVHDTLAQARRRDGQIRDFMVTATLITLQGNTHTHAVWIARDVTDQNVIHEQFKAAFQLTPEFMSITRLRDARIVEVNAAFERITGLSREQAVGKTSAELKLWHDPQQRAAVFKLIQMHGYVREHHVLLNARDGQVREALLSSEKFEVGGEQYMFVVQRDVTETQRAIKALEESEARFSRLFEQSPMPMCYSSDSDGFSSAQWNQAWFDTFGFDVATSQGKSGLALGIWVNQADRARWLERSLRGENTTDAEMLMRRADGELRWISMSSRTFIEPQRTLVLFTYFDITERRRAQQEILELNTQLEARVAQRTSDLQSANFELSQTLATLNMAKDQLVQSEKLAALGALVAGVAHELNTPIGNGLTVASSLEYRVQEFDRLMASGMKRSDLQSFIDDTRQAADILSRNLMRAGALVASFKQVAVDQTSSQRRRFSLAGVASEILITLNPAIRKSACNISLDMQNDLRMDSYPEPLGQVLTNLINNAMVHGFDGGKIPGTITLVARAEGVNQVVIQVRDAGRGIQKADLHRVFEPFFTTRLGQGGSGLGLHIAHSIVTGVLGGSIDVSSEAGSGATFTMTLPLSAPELLDSTT
jgi:PAS domain S-box-containing protein